VNGEFGQKMQRVETDHMVTGGVSVKVNLFIVFIIIILK